MKKKKIKLCLTKQLLNMFKLWCEWGISLINHETAQQAMKYPLLNAFQLSYYILRYDECLEFTTFCGGIIIFCISIKLGVETITFAAIVITFCDQYYILCQHYI